MAAKNVHSDDNKRQELNDITTCCICTEIYTDPKALPCIHTFCLKCIQSTGFKTNRGPGDAMPCPICRRLFKIPAEGFDGLPKNFFIERIMQVANASDSFTASRAVCDACQEDENEGTGIEIPLAEKYCVDCKRKLCEECCSEHGKFKLTKKHKLVTMTEYVSVQKVKSNLAPSVCELHEQKVVDVYCADCKTVVCAICFTADHKNHNGSHVNKFVDDFRKQIESNVEEINECRSQAEIRKAELLKAKEVIRGRVTALECDIENRKDEVKQLAEKHAASLQQDLCSIKQSKMKEIQMETDDIDTYLSNLDTYNFYCQNAMIKGSASDICCAFADLSVRAWELKEQCQPMIEREIHSFIFFLGKSELEQFLAESYDNLIGEIRGQHRYISDPILIQTIKTKSAEEKQKAIWGLTILDKELFVVSERSSEVEVYDSIELSFSRRWNLKELINPFDLGSCARNKCLYIIDFKGIGQSKAILRVDSKGNLIRIWATGDNWGRLSVSNESNVILVDYKTSKLNEYSPDGQLIHEINLSDAGIRYLRHAIKVTNDLFVVSHGYYGDVGGGGIDRHRVCLVDADGKLKKSFGGKRGSTIGQLNNPIYLSVDRNGFIMVADSLNNRVLLLNSNFEFKREIISKEEHGLRHPSRILLDESNDRLFVADSGWNSEEGTFMDGRILIFDFKRAI